MRRAPHRPTLALLAEALELGDDEHVALEASIVRGRGRPGTHRSDATGGPPTQRTNLPPALTSFVGRERVAPEVRQLVETARLVTLAGSPGIGKTRLAMHLASDLQEAFPDGVRLVELAGLYDPALVATTVSTALELREHSDRTPTAALVEHLRDRRVLLLLDNCEHVVTACADLVAALLNVCPRLHVLTTSRQSLGVIGETVFRVPPLSLPDEPSSETEAIPAEVGHIARTEAVRLFVDRAGAVLPGFALNTQNAYAIARVCRRLDGIPLAIELAAVRLHVLSPEQLLARLEDRFQLLRGGNGLVLPRQQTLQATLDWSYELLEEHERTLFNRLSVFAGGFTLEAAERVCSGDGIEPVDVLDLLTALLDKSLVVREMVEPPRCGLLETLRQYAATKLDAEEISILRDRHRQWCVAVAQQGFKDMAGADQLGCLRRLEREHDNLRSALAWTLEGATDPVPGLQIGAGLVRFWDTAGHLREGHDWLDRLLALRTVRSRTINWAGAMIALGYLSALLGHRTRAVALLDEGVNFWREQGDSRGLAMALFFRGHAEAWTSDDLGAWVRAAPFFTESLALARERGPRWAAYYSVVGLANAAEWNDDPEQSESLHVAGLALAREAGDRWFCSMTQIRLCSLALKRGDTERARAYSRESLAISSELGDARNLTYAIEASAAIAATEGKARRAARLFGAAQALREPIGDVLPAIARLSRERGIEAARSLLDDAAFATAWADGRAMSLDRASAYALAGYKPVPDPRLRDDATRSG